MAALPVNSIRSFADVQTLMEWLRLPSAGSLTATWDGVVNLATGTTKHFLGRVPSGVTLEPRGPRYLDTMVTAVNGDTFSWQVSNSGGGVPPPASTDSLFWIAH